MYEIVHKRGKSSGKRHGKFTGATVTANDHDASERVTGGT